MFILNIKYSHDNCIYLLVVVNPYMIIVYRNSNLELFSTGLIFSNNLNKRLCGLQKKKKNKTQFPTRSLLLFLVYLMVILYIRSFFKQIFIKNFDSKDFIVEIPNKTIFK